MAYQMTFKRYEIKYLLTEEEAGFILAGMDPYMQVDKYGETTIRNLYLDNETYRLIRRSMEKPLYKEKLRIRAYTRADGDTPVFVELKKKFKGVVYKRRLTLSYAETKDAFENNTPLPVFSQIGREIDYFRSFYGHLRPTVFLAYERTAYFSRDGSDFRVTFDRNIRFRDYDLTLGGTTEGTPILEDGCCLMELKCAGGIPLWMVKMLSEQQIRKTSFSKYGRAYEQLFAKAKEIAHV